MKTHPLMGILVEQGGTHNWAVKHSDTYNIGNQQVKRTTIGGDIVQSKSIGGWYSGHIEV